MNFTETKEAIKNKIVELAQLELERKLIEEEIKRLEKSAKFTKRDLKTGFLCVTRDGKEYVYFDNIETEYHFGATFVSREGNSWSSLRFYYDDLKSTQYRHLDIVKVYRQYHPYGLCRDFQNEIGKNVLLWERQE